MPKTSDLLSLKEGADYLGLKPVTLRLQILRGQLKAVKWGRDWGVTLRELDRYRAEHMRAKQ